MLTTIETPDFDCGLKAGDVVAFKSGGLYLTVSEVDVKERTASVWWQLNDGSVNYAHAVPITVLSPVRPVEASECP